MTTDGRPMSLARWLDEDDRPGGGGAFVFDEAPAHPGPYSGVCARCLRDRDDLFWHAQERTFYCGDVLRCEQRYYLQAAR